MSRQNRRAPEDSVDQEWRPIEPISSEPHLGYIGGVHHGHAEVVADECQGPSCGDNIAAVFTAHDFRINDGDGTRADEGGQQRKRRSGASMEKKGGRGVHSPGLLSGRPRVNLGFPPLAYPPSALSAMFDPEGWKNPSAEPCRT